MGYSNTEVNLWASVFIVQPNEDLEERVSRKNATSPYILGTGEDILHLKSFFIVCEGEVLPYDITSVKTAIMTLIAIHYVFNLEYPTQTQSVWRFLEKFCFNLSHGKKLSAAAIGLISSIEKQNV